MQELRWTKLYQIPLHGKGNTKEKRRELILRPQYPTLYNEKQMPHVSEISEVIVIVCDSWKVGDLVDWMNSGCLWCGRISQVFDDQEAQIELRPPPHGEGLSYRVLLKDLRPSLDWSTAHGWTLPTQEDGTGHPCARLIKPINQGVEDVLRSVQLHVKLLLSSSETSNSTTSSEVKNTKAIDMDKRVRRTTLSTTSSEVKSTKTIEMDKRVQRTTLSKKQKIDMEKNASQGCGDNNIGKTSQTDTNSRQSTVGKEVVVVLDDTSQKRYMAGGRDALNSRRSGTIEATIVDLEKYINKVKWLKKMLQHGNSSPENQKS
ncbi:uncharacterized protein LOC131021390 isoform X4 [Salvia miltiorrhiza]|uniref:uncharacterized protein LOC131021390 isoform X4 n=1 Tax=Salvia miltiorrhiza TaxID=226208 RepID=UPI0025AC17FB|nr:uncharacterized protein LOC131021390 isoform X4 [Salvia miltiorrhiza]